MATIDVDLEMQSRPYVIPIENSIATQVDGKIWDWIESNIGKPAIEQYKRNGRWFYIRQPSYQRYLFTFKNRKESMWFWVVWG